MNNEIKEILDSLKFVIDNPTLEDELGDKQVKIINYTELNAKESKQLLDYITNLQEENKELNDDNIWWNNRFKAVERDNRDYKSRIDKAIAYIECGKTFDDIETARIIDKYEKILLEILKGDSSNE